MKFFERTFLNLGERWRVRLPDSDALLRQHLDALEEQKRDDLFFLEWCLREAHVKECERSKKDLKQAYKLRETSIMRLQEASTDSQNQTKWNIAYQAADEADKATISYLKRGVHNILFLYEIMFGSLTSFATGIGLLAATNDIFMASLTTIGVLISFIVFSALTPYCYAEQVTSKLVSHLTQDVLSAASQAGIEIESQHVAETEASSNTVPLLA